MVGGVPTRPPETGGAKRIMTGAPLPDESDYVFRIEEVTADPNGRPMLIDRIIHSGENVRHPGEDIDIGQVFIAPGTELGPAQPGLLAGQGIALVLVRPRPRVVVPSDEQ